LGSGQQIGAAPLEDLRGREEIVAEVEQGGGAVRYESDAVLVGDVGKAAGDIRPAGEHHTLDLRADRGQRGTDVFAAIEKGREAGVGNRFARRGDERSEPAGTDITPRTPRAGEHYREAGFQRRPQRGNRMRERMDDNYRLARWTGFS